jgi:hypothetical protein
MHCVREIIASFLLQCRFASSQAKVNFGFLTWRPKALNCGKPQCNCNCSADLFASIEFGMMTKSADLPTIKLGTSRSFASLKQIAAGRPEHRLDRNQTLTDAER